MMNFYPHPGTSPKTTDELDDVLSKIIFVSKVGKGEKIDTKHLKVVGGTLIERTIRTFGESAGESRDTAMIFLKQVKEDALRLARRFLTDVKNEHSVKIGCLILAKLKEMTNGVRSMISTYASDHMAVSNLETYISLLLLEVENIETDFALRMKIEEGEELRGRKGKSPSAAT